MGTSPSSLQAVETIYSKANGGNSNQVLDYKLQLAMPPSLAKAQTIYFRLEQVDHHGASDHSGIFKIERDLKHRYSVFTDGRTIRIVSAESERLNAELYLLSGGEVEKASSNTNELMLRPENRGLYLLVIRDQDTLIGMEKILLE